MYSAQNLSKLNKIYIIEVVIKWAPGNDTMRQLSPLAHVESYVNIDRKNTLNLLIFTLFFEGFLLPSSYTLLPTKVFLPQ